MTQSLALHPSHPIPLPLVEDVALVGVVDGHDEEVDEPGEGVLVHGLYVGQVGDGEEEDGRVHGDGRVAHARLVDLHLRHLGHRLLLRDLVGQHFGRGQDLHRRLILQDVALGRGEHLQDLILNLLQLPEKGQTGKVGGKLLKEHLT